MHFLVCEFSSSDSVGAIGECDTGDGTGLQADAAGGLVSGCRVARQGPVSCFSWLLGPRGPREAGVSIAWLHCPAVGSLVCGPWLPASGAGTVLGDTPDAGVRIPHVHKLC